MRPEILRWSSESVAVRRWRDGVKDETWRAYAGYLFRFSKHVGLSPDQLLELARKEPYKVLDAIQGWIRGKEEDLRYGSAVYAYSGLRSFFLHNRAELPHDRAFRIRAKEAPVERRLTIDDLHQIIGLAGQPYRSMIITKWQGLLDTQGLIYVNWKHSERIVEALRKNEPRVKLRLPGRKKTRNIRSFDTFISTDALASIREYFDRIRGWPKPGEPVWIYQRDHQPVNEHGFARGWASILRKAGLIPRTEGQGINPNVRYGYNVHNTRDLAISLLNTVPDLKPMCIEYWAGHEIDPLNYNQFFSVMPQYVVEQYKLAEPYLNIISQTPGGKHEITGGELVQAIQDHPEIIEQLANMIKERSIR